MLWRVGVPARWGIFPRKKKRFKNIWCRWEEIHISCWDIFVITGKWALIATHNVNRQLTNGKCHLNGSKMSGFPLKMPRYWCSFVILCVFKGLDSVFSIWFCFVCIRQSGNQTTSLGLIWHPLQKKKCRSLERHNDVTPVCSYFSFTHATISPVNNLEKEKSVILSFSAFLRQSADMLGFSASPIDFNQLTPQSGTKPRTTDVMTLPFCVQIPCLVWMRGRIGSSLRSCLPSVNQ